MTHLIVDKRPGTFQRRQTTCQVLAACELGWIRARSSAQARCPPGCAAYRGPGAEALPEEAPGPLPGRACLYCGTEIPPQGAGTPGRPRRFCAGTRCRQYWGEVQGELREAEV